jgi:SpoVK/Ycf46/Vps4 family AAA+-type ATPase
VDKISLVSDDLFHLVRLGMLGNGRQFAAMARKIARRLKRDEDAVGDSLLTVIADEERAGQSVLRKVTRPVAEPQSEESSLLIRGPITLDNEPVLPPDVKNQIEQIVVEHTKQGALSKAGLVPIRSALFLGAPGVGKTMTAHWIAHRLNLPIYTLDLSHLSSSLLGKTGSNIRSAFDFVARNRAVLLVDELDAVAKGRDQEDIGEAKRIVTVLLQQMDHLAPGCLVIGASNHGELLDRAIWRRFEMIVEFPSATPETAQKVAKNFLGESANEQIVALVAKIMDGRPLSEVSTLLQHSLKRKILFDEPVLDNIVREYDSTTGRSDKSSKRELAKALLDSGISQRQASQITGLARETIRKIEE